MSHRSDAALEGAVRESAARESAVRESAVGESAVGESAVREGARRERTGHEGAAGEGRARSRTARLRAELAERTADLQRVKAEYDNYRKRVRRDQAAMRDLAVADALRGLLPVLDAITRARELGDVYGGFQLVAEALEAELAALGLQAFGEYGEPFDPNRHEAVSHVSSPEVDRATCTEIVARGYRLGDHLLRPAKVTVTEPPS